jgi:hypothetical protein
MRNFLLYLFLFSVFASGLWCVIAPDGVVAFRRRRGWPESILSGGYFYANKLRTRITGAMLVVVSLGSFFLAVS